MARTATNILNAFAVAAWCGAENSIIQKMRYSKFNHIDVSSTLMHTHLCMWWRRASMHVCMCAISRLNPNLSLTLGRTHADKHALPLHDQNALFDDPLRSGKRLNRRVLNSNVRTQNACNATKAHAMWLTGFRARHASRAEAATTEQDLPTKLRAEVPSTSA